MNELIKMDDIRQLMLFKNKDSLKSFTNEDQVINFLALQRSFFYFLTAIRAVAGLRLVLHEDLTTSIVFNNKEIPETRKLRFQDANQIAELLTLSELN